MQRRRGALAGCLLVLSVLGVQAGGMGAALAEVAGCDVLRLGAPAAAPGGGVSLTVSVPTRLSGLDVPANAFRVQQGGAQLAVTATKVQTSTASVVLVLAGSPDTSAGSFAAARDAALELLVGLPPDASVAVVSAAGPARVVSPLSRGVARAAAALSLVTLQPGGDLAAGLSLADGLVPAASRGHVVVLTDRPDALVPTLPDGIVRHVIPYAQASTAVRPGCPGGGAPASLLAMVDAVAASVGADYTLTLPALGSGSARVEVSYRGVSAAADLAGPGAAPAPAPAGSVQGQPAVGGADSGGAGGHVAVLVLGVAAAALAALALLGFFGMLLRQNRAASRAWSSPASRDDGLLTSLRESLLRRDSGRSPPAPTGLPAAAFMRAGPVPAAPPAASPAPPGPPDAAFVGDARRDQRRQRTLPRPAVLAAAGGVLVAGVAAMSPLVGVAASVGLLGLLVMARRPQLVTVFVVAAIYSNAPVLAVQFHGLPTVVALAVPVALLIPLLHRLLVLREPLVLPQVFPLLVVFAAIQALSALASQDVRATSGSLVVFLSEGLGLFALVTAVTTTTGALRRLVWVVVLVGAAMGLLSVVQQATGTFDSNYGGFAQVSGAVIETASGTGTTTNAAGQTGAPRLAGPIGEKNRYAQVLVVLIPLSLSLARISPSRRGRLTALTSTAFILAGTVLTYSRGAAVGLALVLLVATGLRLVRPRLLVGLLAAVAVVVLLVPAYADRLTSLESIGASGGDLTSSTTTDNSLRGRATENLAALLVFRENLVLGVGPGAFPRAYQSYAARVGGRPRLEEREAHNLYLGIAAELGIFGLLTFLGILGLLLNGLWKARSAWAAIDRTRSELATGLYLAVVTYMATGLFLHLSYARYFYLLLALAAAGAALPPRTERPAVPAAPERVRELV